MSFNIGRCRGGAVLPFGLRLHSFEALNFHRYPLFWSSLMAQQVKNLPALQETQQTLVQSLGWEDPLEKEMATHSSILAWKFHGRRSLVGCSPKGYKELDTTERLSTHTIFLVTNGFFLPCFFFPLQGIMREKSK